MSTLPAMAVGGIAALLSGIAAAQTGDPIVIGIATADSGWMAAYDQQPANAARLAVEDINARGGVLGRPLEIVFADTKTDRAQGSRAAMEVIGQGAKLVIVSCDYDMGSPAAFAAQSQGIIAISLCANDPKMGIQGVGSHAFSWSFAAQSGGYVLAEWAHAQGWGTAYSLLDTTIEFDKSTCAGFNHRWQELAGAENFLGQDTWRNDDPSIAAQITRIQALPTPPGVIMLCTYNPGGASAIRQLRAAGIDVPLITSQSMDGDYWIDAVPNLSGFYYNAYMSIFGDEPDPARQELLDRYVARFGEKPATSNFITGYAIVEGYAKAIERAGSDDPDAVLAAYEQFQGEDVLGIPITLTPELHIQLQWPVLMMTVENGEHRAIEYVTNQGIPPMELLFPQ